ncbi:MAG: rhodanese-related sulfurtransferase [Myxococcota bacterium]
MTGPIVVAALYRFARLEDPEALRAALRSTGVQHGVVGTLLLASEGVNGTIAGSSAGIEALLHLLRAQPGFEALSPKLSYCSTPPFHRFKVRLKSEIVSMGEADIDPTREVGTYLDPRAWEAALDDPETLVVDTRNTYETRIGTFDGAVLPELGSFRDFPAWVKTHLDPARHRKVAMFCTGGIRCEKATALLLREGFEEVYHLEGGILRYLEETPPEQSRWQGECFVFDQRVAVDAQLRPGRHVLCFGCLEPVSPEDQRSPLYEEGVACPRCSERTTEDERVRRRERRRQMLLAEVRGARHLGQVVPTSTAAPPPGERSPDGILYSFRRCPYAMRARMALAAGGFDPDLREVVLRDKPAALLALGTTTVPAWVREDGQVLLHSLDIMKAVRSERPAAMAFASGADLTHLVTAIDGPFKRALDRYKYPQRYPDEDVSGAEDAAWRELEGVDRLLGDGPYLDGAHAGFHDAAIFPFVRQFAAVDLARFTARATPRLARWRARMAEHPWFLSIMRKLPAWCEGDAPRRFRTTLVDPELSPEGPSAPPDSPAPPGPNAG